ncbi:MAG: nucleotidyltransferase domain-containing protein [Elusimicrobia bacterium]|nr:nucleotidyltransferase domain-containing protein [Elusimicrobiota bacterium]
MSRKLMNIIVNRIVDGYHPDKIILFGSYAYGRPTEGSDIDLFIIKDDDRNRVDRFCEVMKILRDVKGVPIEPLILTNEEFERRLNLEDDFILGIINKGKVLYEREQ